MNIKSYIRKGLIPFVLGLSSIMILGFPDYDLYSDPNLESGSTDTTMSPENYGC